MMCQGSCMMCQVGNKPLIFFEMHTWIKSHHLIKNTEVHANKILQHLKSGYKSYTIQQHSISSEISQNN